MSYFREALQIAKSALTDDCEDDGDCLHMHQPASTDERCRAHTTVTTNDGVFVKALILLPSQNAYSDDPLVSLTLVFIIILFNLAVALHRQGMKDDSIFCRERIEKARSLYLKIHALLRNLGISTTQSSKHELLDLVIMASLNNLIHITFSIAEYETSDLYFRHLHAFANSVGTLEDQNAGASSTLTWYKMAFLHNSSLLRTPPQAAAA